MLNEREREEIVELLRQETHASAAIPEALKVVQRHRGWVSTEAVRAIAHALGVDAGEVESVATFYNLIFRQPVGRHVILLCDSVSCAVTGHDDLRAHLEMHLGITFGGTTPDGRFTLLPIACLGACDRAPAMMIDRTLHGNLTPAQLDEILNNYA
jgi:NADH-quinone oxidoreductase subunit E